MQQLEMVTNNNNDDKKASDFVQIVQPKRPSYKCSICKKIGWQYIHRNNTQSGFRYVFTVHYNEPPIGKSKTGKPVYRTCQQNSRLYDSIEQAISTLEVKEAVQTNKKRLNVKTKHIARNRIDTTSKAVIKQKQKKTRTTKKKGFNCPQCNHRGRLNIANSKTGKFYVTHEKIEGKFWGSKPSTKRQKYNRHYLKLGTETEKASRCYKRK